MNMHLFAIERKAEYDDLDLILSSIYNKLKQQFGSLYIFSKKPHTTAGAFLGRGGPAPATKTRREFTSGAQLVGTRTSPSPVLLSPQASPPAQPAKIASNSPFRPLATLSPTLIATARIDTFAKYFFLIKIKRALKIYWFCRHLLPSVYFRSALLTAALKTQQNSNFQENGSVKIVKLKVLTHNDFFRSAHAEGLFRSACGQQYFFSNRPKTFAGALEECCSYGLKLLSVESKNELDCLFEMNQS